MPKMSTEAILAVIAIFIAVPPAVLAYLQWRAAGQHHRAMRLPVSSTDVSPYPPDEYHIDFLMVRAQGRGRLNNTFAEGMSRLLSSGS